MEIKDIVSNVAVYGLEESFKRSKYPMSVNIDKCTTEYTKTIEHLGTAKSGSGHDNFLKGIIVQFDLTFTIKAWTEAERYHFLILLVLKVQFIVFLNLTSNNNVLNMWMIELLQLFKN